MGDVAVILRVMPKESGGDLAALKKDIGDVAEQIGKISGIDEVPIAFGLKALMLKIVIKDAEGNIDKLERKLSEIPSVQSIETMDMSLI